MIKESLRRGSLKHQNNVLLDAVNQHILTKAFQKHLEKI